MEVIDSIRVEVANPYEVVVGRDLISDLGSRICACNDRLRKVLIVSDSNVAPLYLDECKSSLEAHEVEVSDFIFDAGEKSKNMETISRILKALVSNSFTRTDAIVALGGGVTCDMAGFAASIYLRGIDVYQVPTTLLAQVDASVGGKTGVDMEEGKNLVGTFYQPKLVIIDVNLLMSLSEEVFLEGMAEVIKYAFIADAELYETLLHKVNASSRELSEIVASCVKIKARIVAQDEHDNGIRQSLNFGHTIGHIIERRSNYEISHGIAVARGMVRIMRTSKVLPLLVDMLEMYGIDYRDNTCVEDICNNVTADKKMRGDSITVVLVNEIGKFELKEVTREELRDYL